MDEQRVQAYVELIQKLFACLGGAGGDAPVVFEVNDCPGNSKK